jgi:4-hydroxy-tetrahydrodipicolinate synthase
MTPYTGGFPIKTNDWTALVTPFNPDGSIDWRGLDQNLDFQIYSGMQPLSVGTTAESPTLSHDEHQEVNARILRRTGDKGFVIAGTGGNDTEEALKFTRHAYRSGARCILLVDCYYNGPSSKELREKYYSVIAKEFPDLAIVVYVIPFRTGTELSVEDLAILHKEYPNVIAVKEATENFARMAKTRLLLGKDFDIHSGDDGKTHEMMTRDDISANGVISVTSNILPLAVSEMAGNLRLNQLETAKEYADAMAPLFGAVTVKTVENGYHGFDGVAQKFRNPLPIKTLMNALGLPAGPCRPPLGRMTRQGVALLRAAAIESFTKNEKLFEQLEDFYGIDVEERLHDDKFWDPLGD